MKLRLLFATLLTFAALGAPVVAQPATDPDILQGDIDIIDGGNLEEAISGALDESNQELETTLDNAIAEATEQLSSGAGVDGLFTSPAFIVIIVSLLGSVVTYFTTNGIKLSTGAIKGRRTQLVAGLISVITAGVGGYFALGDVAGVSGINGALLGALSALSSLRIAIGVHETRRQAQTGARKPDRKNSSGVSDIVNSPVGKLAKEGLVALAIKYALPGGALLVDALLSEHTLEQADRIIREMGRKRALTVDEAQADAEATQGARRLPTEPIVAPQG